VGTTGIYDSEGQNMPILAEKLKITKGAAQLLKEYSEEEVTMCAQLEQELNPMLSVVRRRLEQTRKLAILHWMATRGYEEALSGGVNPARRVLTEENIMWGNGVWLSMWTGFNLFMELDQTDMTSSAGVLQTAREDTLKWLSEQSTGVKPSYVKRSFERKLKKLDRTGKIADPGLAFEQSYKMWIKYSNVEIYYPGGDGSRMQRVKFKNY
jgi:hypothetical protein